MSKISSGTTMGKLYADALKIEEKYASLVYELRHIIKDHATSDWAKLMIAIEELLKKHEDID